MQGDAVARGGEHLPRPDGHDLKQEHKHTCVSVNRGPRPVREPLFSYISASVVIIRAAAAAERGCWELRTHT